MSEELEARGFAMNQCRSVSSGSCECIKRVVQYGFVSTDLLKPINSSYYQTTGKTTGRNYREVCENGFLSGFTKVTDIVSAIILKEQYFDV